MTEAEQAELCKCGHDRARHSRHDICDLTDTCRCFGWWPPGSQAVEIELVDQDQPAEISGSVPAGYGYDIKVGATFDQRTGALRFRTDDPVYFEGELGPDGYDQVLVSDAPLRVRIWQGEDGAVRFRIGRWGDMPDRKLREGP